MIIWVGWITTIYICINTPSDIPLKHKHAWLLKPVLSVIDYQLLNSFLIRKEIRPSRVKPDYRNFILRVAQGFCANSIKRSPAPLKVRNRTFSRSKCKSCHDIDPYKDSRSSGPELVNTVIAAIPLPALTTLKYCNRAK